MQWKYLVSISQTHWLMLFVAFCPLSVTVPYFFQSWWKLKVAANRPFCRLPLILKPCLRETARLSISCWSVVHIYHGQIGSSLTKTPIDRYNARWLQWLMTQLTAKSNMWWITVYRRCEEVWWHTHYHICKRSYICAKVIWHADVCVGICPPPRSMLLICRLTVCQLTFSNPWLPWIISYDSYSNYETWISVFELAYLISVFALPQILVADRTC